jgi:hypothetical protein
MAGIGSAAPRGLAEPGIAGLLAVGHALFPKDRIGALLLTRFAPGDPSGRKGAYLCGRNEARLYAEGPRWATEIGPSSSRRVAANSHLVAPGQFHLPRPALLL